MATSVASLILWGLQQTARVVTMSSLPGQSDGSQGVEGRGSAPADSSGCRGGPKSCVSLPKESQNMVSWVEKDRCVRGCQGQNYE